MNTLERLIDRIPWESLGQSAFHILIVLLMVSVGVRALRIALARLERRMIQGSAAAGEIPSETHKRAGTLIGLLRQGATILLWVTAVLIILREVGVEIAPLLASAGIVGVALGFGAQHLVRDVITGFFMILENQLRVNDAVVINGTSGTVERISFRTVVLRDPAGKVHIFPNGTINTLTNLTRDWSGYLFEVSVAFASDIDHVSHIMNQAGAILRNDELYGPLMTHDVEVFGIDRFTDTSVVIKGRIKTLPGKQAEVGRAYLAHLKRAFAQAHIALPGPPPLLPPGVPLPTFNVGPAPESR